MPSGSSGVAGGISNVAGGGTSGLAGGGMASPRVERDGRRTPVDDDGVTTPVVETESNKVRTSTHEILKCGVATKNGIAPQFPVGRIRVSGSRGRKVREHC